MGRPQYGDTWWGAQWLQALTQIDHENRLPRGRTYANRGAVLDLAVQDCRIRARVQGSRPRPYDIDIERARPSPQPTPHAWSKRLAADAGLIGRLLNRELDPAVLQEARRLSHQGVSRALERPEDAAARAPTGPCRASTWQR